MTRQAKSVLIALAAVALAVVSNGAWAQGCRDAIAAAKAEWRSLTKGNHNVAPTMRVVTSDGRRLTGSQLNYAWVLITRADDDCANGDTEATADLQNLRALLHPAASTSRYADQ